MVHMKRYGSLAVVAVVIAALAASSVALAAGGLSGTYTTTIKSPAQSTSSMPVRLRSEADAA